jgi:alkyldihydroxyacetonephosphate synthase
VSHAATLSTRPARRFWGWGWRHEQLTPAEVQAVHAMVGLLGGGSAAPLPEPREDEFELAPPRIAAPAALATIFSASPYDRLTHCGGKSCADVLRLWARQAPRAPDWVAYPRDERDIVDVLDWASRHGVAVVPFGGGTSVVGGVEPAVGEGYVATVSLDVERLSRVLEVDATSRSARIQAGVLGPELEAQLRPHGLTLRHYPQSFALSTLGGWIATRAGGHYATLYTHIDDFVQATRSVTPAGTLETRRLPGSGAGPAPDRLIIGSEGTLGVITEAWMRLQQRPRFRAAAAVRFAGMVQAVAAVRALSQSGLNPSNLRLLDPAEVGFNRVGDGRSPTLMLAFESADHPLQAWMARALELVADHGGRVDADAGASTPFASHGSKRGPSDQWRDTFLRMPYYRDEATRLGTIIDTFESAVTWDRFDAFYDGVRRDVAAAIEAATGREGFLSCRFTHVYPDGPAPYFTFAVQGSTSGDLGSALAAWREIKLACNASVVAHGGTITHHHAVGREHRSGYDLEVPALWRSAFAAAKQALDPRGVMNPGVLVDPAFGGPLR